MVASDGARVTFKVWFLDFARSSDVGPLGMSLEIITSRIA